MSTVGANPRRGWHLVVNGSRQHARVLEALGLEDLSLTRYEGNWLLYLEDIQEGFLEGGPKDRLAKGRATLEAINGLAEVRAPLPEPFQAEKIVEVDEEGEVHGYVFLSATVDMSPRLSGALAAGGGETEELNHIDMTREAPHALGTARRRRSLRLMADDPGFRELYFVYEDALEGLGGRGGVEAAGVSWAEVQRFKQTANSHDAIEDEARHGAANTIPEPDEPMGLPEARRLVTQIVDHWLNQAPRSS